MIYMSRRTFFNKMANPWQRQWPRRSQQGIRQFQMESPKDFRRSTWTFGDDNGKRLLKGLVTLASRLSSVLSSTGLGNSCYRRQMLQERSQHSDFDGRTKSGSLSDKQSFSVVPKQTSSCSASPRIGIDELGGSARASSSIQGLSIPVFPLE
jgi:hypothetical protein